MLTFRQITMLAFGYGAGIFISGFSGALGVATRTGQMASGIMLMVLADMMLKKGVSILPIRLRCSSLLFHEFRADFKDLKCAYCGETCEDLRKR